MSPFRSTGNCRRHLPREPILTGNPTLDEYRTNPIPDIGQSLQSVLFSTEESLAAKAYAFGEALQQGGTIVFSLPDNLTDWNNSGLSIGQYLGEILAHEIGHSLGLEDAYLFQPPGTTDTSVPKYPYDLMSTTPPSGACSRRPLRICP